MREERPIDNALLRIVVDGLAVDLGQEPVAVGHPGAEPSGGPGLGERALHSVLAQWMGARPFRRLAIGPALDPRFERRLASQRGENPAPPAGS